ncbi:hypothetical protein [uncultured Lacinutrix sp.]|uniref:hypothetical protein n=1 Tax=uncultured Lacinutrix sp. TaxID=574032 RepID=UPI00261E7903|nr:hypothetical protein [uncultured Lacinutrix sp.]
MRVVNIHRRKINEPIEKVSCLLKTLSTKDDAIWPYEQWPAIRFEDGIKVGSKGGHGRIRYKIIDNNNQGITFQFISPEGFVGTHQLAINSIHENKTEIIHEIKMTTYKKATLLWLIVIRWLHDALIEDAFDKVESYYSLEKKITPYNLWVRVLRFLYK